MSRRKLVSEVAAHKITLAQLELANTALRHFTDAASHDLRAPLRTIRGFLAALALKSSSKLDDQARDLLDRSRSAADRLDSLLNSLLAYARLQKPLGKQAVDCQRLIEDVLADVSEQVSLARATITVDPLPTVTGDPDRLYQLFLNLIGNALKFRRPEEPLHVHLSAQARGDEWTFCVEDNGIGIDPASHRAIFAAFTRLHQQKQYEGSGLGLAICHQIVEQHGGRIWVESAARHGSRFCVALPVHVDVPPP